MPDWLTPALNGVQLTVNVAAVVGGAAVWRLYIDNLKAALTSKDAEISSVEKNRDFWKDKAQDLEKQSPEFMEKILSERIGTREAEIGRLAEDKEKNEESLRLLEQEKSVLERDLGRTQGFRTMLALEGEDEQDPEFPEDPMFRYDTLEVVLLGEVGVDSGQLLITDPCYIDSEWQEEPFEDVRAFQDAETGNLVYFGKDFRRFDEVIPSLGETMTALIGSGRFVERKQEVPTVFPYSYNGACKATLSKGHGELVYQKGQPGAGVVFGTAFGDGVYPIYGEKHDGRIMRVYVNVA
jgi:hypothetical protein